MKLLKLSFLFVAISVATLTYAQNVNEIVNKHIEAIGGKDKIENMKSLYTEGVMSVMGNEAPMKITILNGKGFKSEVEFNGQKIVQTITDKGGWAINPMTGSTTAQAVPEEQYKLAKDQLYIGGPLLDYAAKGNKVELSGRENVGAVNAYKLKVTSKDSSVSTYYLDPATYYIIKAVKEVSMNGQSAEVAVNFSNYKKTDYGYVVPYSIATTFPGMTMTSTINKVEVNKAVDPQIFSMPK